MKTQKLALPNGETATRIRLVMDRIFARILVKRVSVLKYTNTRELILESFYKIEALNCPVLSGVSSLQVLRLDSNIRVNGLKFAKCLFLKVLEVGASTLEDVDFGCLEYLQELFIITPGNTFSVQIFRRLPESLKNVHVVSQQTRFLDD